MSARRSSGGSCSGVDVEDPHPGWLWREERWRRVGRRRRRWMRRRLRWSNNSGDLEDRATDFGKGGGCGGLVDAGLRGSPVRARIRHIKIYSAKMKMCDGENRAAYLGNGNGLERRANPVLLGRHGREGPY